jgi:hypothetical protein
MRVPMVSAPIVHHVLPAAVFLRQMVTALEAVIGTRAGLMAPAFLSVALALVKVSPRLSPVALRIPRLARPRAGISPVIGLKWLTITTRGVGE